MMAAACGKASAKQANEGKPVPVIGLALSGGGAKGFAHIGVLKVLEEEGIPIRVVTGTSMGSIIGGLYAIGYSPQMLEEIAMRSDWLDFFMSNPTRDIQPIFERAPFRRHIVTVPLNEGKVALPQGFFEAQEFSLMLSQLTLPYHKEDDFTKFPIPYGCVVTDLETGEARFLTGGDLATAMRASSAFPSAFKPVEIDGRFYIDGGLVRNIPVDDARGLGADFVITVDVSSELKTADRLTSFLDILNQAVAYSMKESDKEQIAKSDFYISPDVKEFNVYDVNKVTEIIALGEEAARAALPRLKEKLAAYSYDAGQSGFRPIRESKTITYDKISVHGVSGGEKIVAEEILQFYPGGSVSIQDLNRTITKLYRTGLYETITYSLEGAGDSENVLVFNITPYIRNRFAFGARYDTDNKASLLFSLDKSSFIFKNDLLLSDARLGTQFHLKGNYFIPYNFARSSGMNIIGQIRRSPFDIYSGRDLSSSVNVEVLSLDFLTGIQLFNNLTTYGGVHLEAFNINRKIGETLLFEGTNTNASLKLMIYGNTVMRTEFPDEGYNFFIDAEASQKGFDSKRHLAHISFQWLNYIPLTDYLTLIPKVIAGHTAHKNYPIPLHKYYFAGGTIQKELFRDMQFPFYGRYDHELRGLNVQYAQLAARAKLLKRFYVTGVYNVANLSDTWDWDFNYKNLHHGFGFSIGTSTVVGPVELKVDTRSAGGPYSVRMNVGYYF